MQASAIMLAHELSNSAAFNDLLQDLIREQSERRVDAIRKAARTGNAIEAALAEGELALLMELPRIFSYYSAKYHPS